MSINTNLNANGANGTVKINAVLRSVNASVDADRVSDQAFRLVADREAAGKVMFLLVFVCIQGGAGVCLSQHELGQGVHPSIPHPLYTTPPIYTIAPGGWYASYWNAVL